MAHQIAVGNSWYLTAVSLNTKKKVQEWFQVRIGKLSFNHIMWEDACFSAKKNIKLYDWINDPWCVAGCLGSGVIFVPSSFPFLFVSGSVEWRSSIFVQQHAMNFQWVARFYSAGPAVFNKRRCCSIFRMGHHVNN